MNSRTARRLTIITIKLSLRQHCPRKKQHGCTPKMELIQNTSLGLQTLQLRSYIVQTPSGVVQIHLAPRPTEDPTENTAQTEPNASCERIKTNLKLNVCWSTSQVDLLEEGKCGISLISQSCVVKHYNYTELCSSGDAIQQENIKIVPCKKSEVDRTIILTGEHQKIKKVGQNNGAQLALKFMALHKSDWYITSVGSTVHLKVAICMAVLKVEK